MKLSRWAEPRKEKNIANRRKEITERWIDVTVEELGCKRSERFLVKHLPKIDDPRPVTDDRKWTSLVSLRTCSDVLTTLGSQTG